MIHDAELGRFDLILTKEVSRFARNTVDVLNYTRELKMIGVGVYFLNDSINTLDNDGELRLSIMSSIAQEESRKTSERVKFGQHERMKQGVVFGRDMLGYDVREGKLYLNDEGAEVVKKIFNKYTVEGKGTHVIARELTDEGILSLNPDGSVKNGHSWSAGTIIKILRNEKYVGDLCQHKTITTSCLTHKKKYNRGEQDFVYIRDHHPDIAIIDRDLWDRTQAELERRKMTDEQRQKYSNRYWASGKIFCGECGDSYIHNMLRRKDGSQYSTWKCFTNNNYGHKKVVKGRTIGCDSFVLNGQVLNVCMDYILSFILKDKEILIKRMKREIKAVLERRTPSGNKDKILQKISSFEDKITRLIDLKLDGQITSEEMKLAKEKYNKNIEVLKIQLDNIIREEENNQNEAARIEGIIAEIRKLLDFDISCARDELYKSVTNKIVVYNGKTLLVYLNCLPTPIKLKYHKQKEKYGKYYNSDRKDLSHWLTGLLRCEKCGKVLSYQGGYFGCSERSRGKCDGVGYIKAEKIANIILNILSEIELPNVEMEFAEPNSAKEVNINDDSRIISAQVQRLEIRLERVKLAYEDGVDTLEEYKAKKKAITDEIVKLKEMIEQDQEEEPKEEVKLNKKELRRLTEVLKDADVSNMEKNNMARTIFKEIIKGGDDGKRLKCVFWRH